MLFEFKRSHIVTTNLLYLPLLWHIQIDWIWTHAFNQSAFYLRKSATTARDNTRDNTSALLPISIAGAGWCQILWIKMNHRRHKCSGWLRDNSLTRSLLVTHSSCRPRFRCFQRCETWVPVSPWLPYDAYQLNVSTVCLSAFYQLRHHT